MTQATQKPIAERLKRWLEAQAQDYRAMIAWIAKQHGIDPSISPEAMDLARRTSAEILSPMLADGTVVVTTGCLYALNANGKTRDAHGSRSTLARRDFFLQEEGHLLYEGHRLGEDNLWSVGTSPEGATRAFCLARCDEPLDEGSFLLLEEENKDGWYARFTCDGTSFKAAGSYVPGGAILTWWK